MSTGTYPLDFSTPGKRGYRRCGVLGLDLSGFSTYRELALPERLPYTSTGSFAILTLPLL